MSNDITFGCSSSTADFAVLKGALLRARSNPALHIFNVMSRKGYDEGFLDAIFNSSNKISSLEISFHHDATPSNMSFFFLSVFDMLSTSKFVLDHLVVVDAHDSTIASICVYLASREIVKRLTFKCIRMTIENLQVIKTLVATNKFIRGVEFDDDCAIEALLREIQCHVSQNIADLPIEKQTIDNPEDQTC